MTIEGLNLTEASPETLSQWYHAELDLGDLEDVSPQELARAQRIMDAIVLEWRRRGLMDADDDG